MERGQLILSLRARPDNLVHLRALIVDFLGALGVEGEAADAAKLSVSEIATNAILHGYGGVPGEIGLEARAEDDHLVIAVSDCGRGRGTRPRDALEAGRGIPIVETLAETVEIARDEQGTRVELTFAVR